MLLCISFLIPIILIQSLQEPNDPREFQRSVHKESVTLRRLQMKLIQVVATKCVLCYLLAV